MNANDFDQDLYARQSSEFAIAPITDDSAYMVYQAMVETFGCTPSTERLIDWLANNDKNGDYEGLTFLEAEGLFAELVADGSI